MAMQSISYGCTALAGTNKVGNLKRDANGYYPDVVLGALQAYNSAGAYYEFEQSKALFEGSSELMRRIRSGNCRGEAGHPRYQEGMSERAWFARVNDMYEPNLCVHFASIDLSYNTLRDAQGRPLVAVIGRIRPSGANERYLERQLDNPEENVCFSVRSFTRDVVEGGRLVKYLQKIVTWDNVNEPGISVANKYQSPSLESMSPVQIADLDEHVFSLNTVREVAHQEEMAGVSMESNAPGSSLLQMIAHVEKKTRVYVPASFAWSK